MACAMEPCVLGFDSVDAQEETPRCDAVLRHARELALQVGNRNLLNWNVFVDARAAAIPAAWQ